MTTAVKRACDACHRRKVKCDGINPCRNCSSAQLGCTYNAIPQKKGPKGSRAKVISELRETQRQTSLSAKVQNRLNGVNCPAPPSLAPNPGLLTPEIVKESVDFFFNNMYPTIPILHRQRLEQQAMYMDSNLDTYCFLTSLCAFMMFQPGMAIPGSDPFVMDSLPGANIVSGTVLMEETMRVRKGYDYLDSPTLNGICTSYFLFACHYALDLHKKAWFHLREATTLAHMIGMNKEETYLQFDNIEASRRRRLYWLLFVTERAYALQHGRPVTLQATINLPVLGDDQSDPMARSQLAQFVTLVSLFRQFDDSLINQWNKTRGDCSPSYLSALKNQCREVMPAYMSTDSQFNDAAKNQQWVKNLAWQVGMANGNGNEMSYQYPMEVSNDVLSMASSFSTAQGMNLHSVSLIEKLLTVTSDLADVLTLYPASRVPYIEGPREYLNHVLEVLAILRNGEHRFTPLLLNKVHDILPRLANPMLREAPESAAMCNVDIFDGFGNAGMAQPPCLDYETKYSVPRIEEYKTETSPSGSAPSSKDLSSPYVGSSPPLLTPGIEYSHPHGLPTDFAMSDMVMSPMTAAPGSALNTPGGINPQQTPHQQQAMLLNHGMSQSLEQSQAMYNNALTSMAPMPNSMLVRQQPSRSNSFAMPPAQIRTVGDFQALQRANSDLGSLGINNMGAEIDFNTLR